MCIRAGVCECMSARESNEDFGTQTQSEFTLSTEEVQVWPVARNECEELVSDLMFSLCAALDKRFKDDVSWHRAVSS